MNKTKPKFQDENAEIVFWVPKEVNRHIEETLQKLAEYNVKVTKSAFIRRAVADKLYNLDSFFALLALAERKEGGVNIDE